jgi:uncharacterized membrane protein
MQGLLAIVNFNWPDFLGPFHVVMLHYPIGFLTLAVLLEIRAMRRPSDAARRAVGFTLGLSVAVAWLVAGLGFLRAVHGEFDPRLVALHRTFGLGFAMLATVTWMLHRRLYPNPDRLGLRRTYRGLLGLSMVLLVIAAHQGGSLTHGARFLTEGAPRAVSSLLDSVEAAAVPPEIKPDDVYHATIEPLLAKKCYQCHGPEKQKGKFRLDERDRALAGGESGEAAIVPGEPLRSALVKRILLPHDHDDVMPPDGKEALTAEEKLALVNWIQSGAPFGLPPATP